MITEDYVSFETAKLLKEKGYNGPSVFYDEEDAYRWNSENFIEVPNPNYEPSIPFDTETFREYLPHVTLAMAMKWLREAHSILLIADYDYECTDKSYCYKIYKLGENGKPERVPIEGVRYDTLDEPHTEIVAYRDYKRSYFDYKTYEEACEAGIRYCLENLI